MKHILTIILCTASCFCYGQERRQTESREGWWNDNPSFVVPIREIGVTARRPMKEIGVQKTRLDTLVLHENIALSAGPRSRRWRSAVRRRRTRR